MFLGCNCRWKGNRSIIFSIAIIFMSMCSIAASGKFYTLDRQKLSRRTLSQSESKRSPKRLQPNSQSLKLYSQLNGLFGKKIAEKIDKVPSDLSAESKIYFIPEKQFLGCNVYYVCVTPKTHLVYKIVAEAKFLRNLIEDNENFDAFPMPKLEEVKEFPILAKKAIEKKYDEQMVVKGLSWELEGVNGGRSRKIRVSRLSNFSVFLADLQGYELAKKEQAELDVEKSRRIDEKRNITAEDAIDAL